MTEFMSLKVKLAIVALVYSFALLAHVSLCIWAIDRYYRPVIGAFGGEVITSDTAEPAAVDERGIRDMPGRVLTRDASYSVTIVILLLHTIVGLAFLLGMLRLSVRWFLDPLRRIHEAALELGRGNWCHRIRYTAPGPLGALANRINGMAESIASMQEAVMAYESRQVAREAARCVAHNIRGPMNSIRWLAEVHLERSDLTQAQMQRQKRMVAIVDTTLKSINEFRNVRSGDTRQGSATAHQSAGDRHG